MKLKAELNDIKILINRHGQNLKFLNEFNC